MDAVGQQHERTAVEIFEIARAGCGGGVVPEEGQAAVGAARLFRQFDDDSEGLTLVEVHVALG